MRRRRLPLLLLLLLAGRGLFAPAAVAQSSPGKLGGAGEDLFAPFTPQGMLSERTLHKSLPPLTRQETIVWSFRTARPGPFQ